ncbi:hypothetical protein RJ639_031849 [Escallonia herrerae]|uniref:Dolichyl-diphosphooligosaccharide--protein glycosyltransferase subunit 4 n=1 Tax=Escallonia herrerae TaxID=1293975 RepID=A0AA88X6G3_9ASTE|nr:hypothetical protein RJ639_031849 [Escallonia herrerae]
MLEQRAASGESMHQCYGLSDGRRVLLGKQLGTWVMMIDDRDLGFIANFLGIFIFALVIAYHYVTADPKYEANRTLV